MRLFGDPRATPNRLRLIPRIARCACGEVVISRDTNRGEQCWCAECRAFVGEVVRAAEQKLGAPALPPDGIDLVAYLTHLECSLIEQACERAGSIYGAAKILGLKRTTLSEKIRKLSPVHPRLARFRGEKGFPPQRMVKALPR